MQVSRASEASETRCLERSERIRRVLPFLPACQFMPSSIPLLSPFVFPTLSTNSIFTSIFNSGTNLLPRSMLVITTAPRARCVMRDRQITNFGCALFVGLSLVATLRLPMSMEREQREKPKRQCLMSVSTSKSPDTHMLWSCVHSGFGTLAGRAMSID